MRSNLEGLYEYTHRINSGNEIKADIKQAELSAMQKSEMARSLKNEAADLKNQGTAGSLRSAAIRLEESLQLWKGAGPLS